MGFRFREGGREGIWGRVREGGRGRIKSRRRKGGVKGRVKEGWDNRGRGRKGGRGKG